MEGAPPFGMDKQFAPSAVRIQDPPEARKNFSVSHLLDLEEVGAAAGLNGAPQAGQDPRQGGRGAQEPSGGSSGSEGGAAQEGHDDGADDDDDEELEKSSKIQYKDLQIEIERLWQKKSHVIQRSGALGDVLGAHLNSFGATEISIHQL